LTQEVDQRAPNNGNIYESPVGQQHSSWTGWPQSQQEQNGSTFMTSSSIPSFGHSRPTLMGFSGAASVPFTPAFDHFTSYKAGAGHIPLPYHSANELTRLTTAFEHPVPCYQTVGGLRDPWFESAPPTRSFQQSFPMDATMMKSGPMVAGGLCDDFQHEEFLVDPDENQA
jgi:hypothetical protein